MWGLKKGWGGDEMRKYGQERLGGFGLEIGVVGGGEGDRVGVWKGYGVVEMGRGERRSKATGFQLV